MRARTSSRQKLGWVVQSSLRTGVSLVMPKSAIIYANPLDEVAFLVNAASRARPDPGRSSAVLAMLAELRAREAALGRDRPLA
jgi:phytoene synthase